MDDFFCVDGWAVESDDKTLSFQFSSGRYGHFTETLAFPTTMASLSATAAKYAPVLDVLAVALGTSYYKTNPAGQVCVRGDPPGDAALEFLHALYVEGLGEFYVRNELAYPPKFAFAKEQNGAIEALSFTGDDIGLNSPVARQWATIGDKATGTSAVAAFGGGKDSHVALAILRAAKVSTESVAVALSERAADKLKSMSIDPLTIIHRRIDPQLIEANKAGALNGHIPITAINSLSLVVYALMQRSDWVVFANERAADEPTMMLGAHEINHQFSKTFRCENLLRRMLKSMPLGVPNYFSVLRPFSELWVARQLVSDERALATFASCNRNFIFSGPNALPAGVRWCRKCAKCAFTALITAPFMSRQRSVSIFGGDVLDDLENVNLVREITGLAAAKPWDCVGTTKEAAAALFRLSELDDWKSVRAAKECLPQLQHTWGERRLKDVFVDALISKGTSFLPKELRFVYEP